MNSSYVIVPPPPQNHPRAWKESAPLLWKCKGLETKSKGPSQCPMSKVKSTSGVQLFPSAHPSRELSAVLRG